MRKKKVELDDIQKTKVKGMKLNRVGISNLDFPMYIKTKKGDTKLCYANVNIFVSLKRNIKGINMSRIPRALMKYRYTSFSRWVLWKYLYGLKKFSETSDVYAEVNFKYFIDKEAPVTKEKSVMAYDCCFIGRIDNNNRYTFQLKVKVIGTSNCPCSKEISEGQGAHGQRSEITATVTTKRKKTMYLEDLIKIVEGCMSCEIYPVLKRPDEKYVTIKAYNNPKFVEDEAREVGWALQRSIQLIGTKLKL